MARLRHPTRFDDDQHSTLEVCTHSRQQLQVKQSSESMYECVATPQYRSAVLSAPMTAQRTLLMTSAWCHAHVQGNMRVFACPRAVAGPALLGVPGAAAYTELHAEARRSATRERTRYGLMMTSTSRFWSSKRSAPVGFADGTVGALLISCCWVPPTPAAGTPGVPGAPGTPGVPGAPGTPGGAGPATARGAACAPWRAGEMSGPPGGRYTTQAI